MSKAYKEYKLWRQQTQASQSLGIVTVDHVEETNRSNLLELNDYIRQLIIGGPEFIAGLSAFENGAIDSKEMAAKLRSYREVITNALVKIDTGW